MNWVPSNSMAISTPRPSVRRSISATGLIFLDCGDLRHVSLGRLYIRCQPVKMRSGAFMADLTRQGLSMHLQRYAICHKVVQQTHSPQTCFKVV